MVSSRQSSVFSRQPLIVQVHEEYGYQLTTEDRRLVSHLTTLCRMSVVTFGGAHQRARKACYYPHGQDARAPLFTYSFLTLLQALADFCFGEGVVRCFGALVDSLHHFIACGHAVAFQPEQHIRLPAHGADVDDLFQSEHL